MSTYRVTVRFLNGEKTTYEVKDVNSHDEAKQHVKDNLLGVKTCVSLKMREPLVCRMPEAA